MQLAKVHYFPFFKNCCCVLIWICSYFYASNNLASKRISKVRKTEAEEVQIFIYWTTKSRLLFLFKSFTPEIRMLKLYNKKRKQIMKLNLKQIRLFVWNPNHPVSLFSILFYLTHKIYHSFFRHSWRYAWLSAWGP